MNSFHFRSLNETVSILLVGILVSWAETGRAQEKQKNTDSRGIFMRVEVWQMPQLEALRVLDQARGEADSTAIVSDLREKVKSGESLIKLITLPSITAVSGQRAKTVAGEKKYLSRYVPSPDGETEVPQLDRYLNGTSFEVDPVMGEDGKTLFLNLAVDHTLETPSLRDATMIGPVTGQELNIELVDENQAEITTRTTMISGQTRLLGSVPNRIDQTALLVFLFAEVVNPEKETE